VEIGDGATLARKNPTCTRKADFKPLSGHSRGGRGLRFAFHYGVIQGLRLTLRRLSMQEAQALATVEDVDQFLAYQRKSARL